MVADKAPSALETHFGKCATDNVKHLASSLQTIIENKNVTEAYLEAIASITGKDAAKRKKEVPRLQQNVMDFNNLSQSIAKSWITNHQRLKYNDELLHAVIRHSIEEKGEEYLFGKNTLTRMMGTMFKEQLQLVVEPFNILNATGDITNFYEHFPLIIRAIAAGKKFKIVRACFFLLAQLIHLIDNRPDIMRQIAIMAPFTNEVHIEFHNSTIARRVKNMDVVFQNLRNESVNTSRIRDMYHQLSDLLDFAVAPDGEGDSSSSSSAIPEVVVASSSASSSSSADLLAVADS